MCTGLSPMALAESEAHEPELMSDQNADAVVGAAARVVEVGQPEVVAELVREHAHAAVLRLIV